MIDRHLGVADCDEETTDIENEMKHELLPLLLVVL